MGSRLLPLSATAVALAASSAGLTGLALYVGLVAVPLAAAAAYTAASDWLEGEHARLRAFSSSLALTLLVTASAVRYDAPAHTGTPPLASWSLVLAVVAYAIPAVAWVLEPLRYAGRKPAVFSR
ncbi:MAG: hypothetical protein JO073_14385 [Actinobacteria bacterium]|nr:hypothetical protein [Actinomycetota bacterium]